MPIRTDRGRAAALRHFWSWPLRSGRHMLVTLAAAAVVITGFAVASHAITDPDTDSPSAVAESRTHAPAGATGGGEPPPVGRTPTEQDPSISTRPPSSTSSTGESAPTVHPGSVDDGKDGAATTARKWVTHWARVEGVNKEEWVETLTPLTLPGKVPDLKTTALERVPDITVTGKTSIEDSEDGVVTVDVATDDDPIRVTAVEYPDDRWLVRSWKPVTS